MSFFRAHFLNRYAVNYIAWTYEWLNGCRHGVCNQWMDQQMETCVNDSMDAKVDGGTYLQLFICNLWRFCSGVSGPACAATSLALGSSCLMDLRRSGQWVAKSYQLHKAAKRQASKFRLAPEQTGWRQLIASVCA